MPECFTAPIIHNRGLESLSNEAKPVMVFNFHGHVVDVHEVQGSALYRKKRGVLMEAGGMERIEID
jgi:hypothetical protein